MASPSNDTVVPDCIWKVVPELTKNSDWAIHETDKNNDNAIASILFLGFIKSSYDELKFGWVEMTRIEHAAWLQTKNKRPDVKKGMNPSCSCSGYKSKWLSKLSWLRDVGLAGDIDIEKLIRHSGGTIVAHTNLPILITFSAFNCTWSLLSNYNSSNCPGIAK